MTYDRHGAPIGVETVEGRDAVRGQAMTPERAASVVFAADCLAETVANWLEQACPGGAMHPWEKDAEAALRMYRATRAEGAARSSTEGAP